MKKKLLSSILAITTIGVVIPSTTLFQTSCSQGLATAPNEFYYVDGSDYVGYGSPTVGMGDVDSARTIYNYTTDVKSLNQPFYELLTNRSKYTDNMIKWDIINTFVYNLGLDGGQPFNAKFVEFVTTNTTIKCKLELTYTKIGITKTYSTSSNGEIGGKYGPFTITQDDMHVFDTNNVYSSYKLPWSEAIIGSVLNSMESVFVHMQKESPDPDWLNK